jgi:outer membrane protein assembly factor BamB
LDAGEVTGSPEVVNGMVYVSTTSTYIDTFVVDAGTGAVVHHFETEGGNQTMTVLGNGDVYLGDDGLDAFHYSGNTFVDDWYSNHRDEDTTPVIWGGRVYVGTDTGHLGPTTPGGEHLYPSTQKTDGPVGPTWAFSTGTLQSVTSTPAVADSMVFVESDDGSLYAFALPGGN